MASLRDTFGPAGVSRRAMFQKRPEGLVDGIGSFGNDITTLVSLQAQLAAMDLKESMSKAALSFVALGLAMMLSLAALAVLLVGLGMWLTSRFALPTGVSLMIVSLTALVICGVLAFFASRKVHSSFSTFIRSREELQRNVAWIKTILAQSGR